ncbi:MAG: RIP metalloprotease RseP, partial [Kiritimatiellaeota bacterium]|nr:RIP metalloprotease RseP [Kiritimatiellota bacterium]
MLTTLYVIAVILLLGATIFVHEFGHYLVARWCGMVIDTFSIGFGPALWKRKVGDITYKVGCIPFGGYVALPQMDPTHSAKDEAQQQERVLPYISPWKRILVAIAGGGGNILFAFLLAWIIYIVGKPSSPEERNCVIGYIDTNCAAYAAGLRLGDEIIAINNEPVKNWYELFLNAVLTQQAHLRVTNAVGVKEFEVPVVKGDVGVSHIEGLGIQNYCDVTAVDAGSVADKAGMRADDRIIELDGVTLLSREHLSSLVQANLGKELACVVLRKGQRVSLRVTPAYDAKYKRPRIGIVFPTSMFDLDYDRVTHPKPLAQLRDHATYVLRVLKALTTPKEMGGAAQGLGGPVEVIRMFWWAVKRGFVIALWFTGFFNVNLAIINLLPIPILDGGHIIFALWELITRRPVHRKVANALMNFFVALILLAFVLLTYRDVARIFFSGRHASA